MAVIKETIEKFEGGIRTGRDEIEREVIFFV